MFHSQIHLKRPLFPLPQHLLLFVLFLFGHILFAPIAHAQNDTTPTSPPPVEAFLKGEFTPIAPALLDSPVIPFQPTAVLTASLSFSPTALSPGDPVSLTLHIANIGTAPSEPTFLALQLSSTLSPTNSLTFTLDPSIPAYTATLPSLASGENQTWTFPLNTSRQIDTPPTASLYGRSQSQTQDLQATATLTVSGLPTSATQSDDEDKGWKPRFNAPSTSLFSGAATYSHAFDVPPGRRGLQPALSLSYNSRATDGMVGWVHSGEVGEGWSLGGIPSIVREDVKFCWSNNPEWICVLSRFSLTLGGNSYNLIPTFTEWGHPYGIYQAIGNPGLYVERRNPAGQNGSTSNKTGEYWVVRTPDGTEYRLGYTEDAEQTLFRTNGTNDPQHPDGTPYTGQLSTISVYRWWLDQTVDVYGNALQITYLDDANDGRLTVDECTGNACREVATYPDKIFYNNAQPYVLNNWQSEIDFNYNSSYRETVGHAEMVIFATMLRLGSLTMKQAGQVVWDYSLNYEEFGTHGNNTVIASIATIRQRDFTMAVILPITSFGYVELNNGGEYDYPRLKTVDNGMGGVYEFSYNASSLVHGAANVKSYYVTAVKSWDGVRQVYAPNATPTNITNIIYNPTHACFDDWLAPAPNCDSGPGDDSNKLVGFSTVQVTVQSGSSNTILSDTRSGFHVGNWLLNGRQHWQGSYSGAALLQESHTAWSSNDADCPQAGLWFDYFCVHAEQQIAYYYPSTGGTNQFFRETIHTYDPAFQDGRQWGMTTAQTSRYELKVGNEVLQSAPLQRNMTGYQANLGRWVLVPWFQSQYDSDNNLNALQLFLYDGANDPDDQPIDKGALTLTRVVWLEDRNVGANVEYDSVDTSTTYDTYGNPNSSTTYAGYGRVGYSASNWDIASAPGNGSTASATTTTYDNFGQRVQAVQKPLYPAETIGYHPLFTWLPTSTTTSSGLTTFYVYDSMGRLGTVIAPGDTADDPTVAYSYDTTSRPIRLTKTLLPNHATFRQETSQYLNGFGQLLQESQVGVTVEATLQDVVMLTSYDALGRPICQSVPLAVTFNSGFQSTTTCASQDHTTTAYDARGGIYQTTSPDGTIATRTFSIPGEWATTVGRGISQERFDNPNGDITFQTTNALGQLDWVGQKNDGGPCSRLEVTTYNHDPLGNLEQVARGGFVCGTTYTAGTTFIEMAYDSLGRKESLSDPDMGDWVYFYNPTGSLTRQAVMTNNQQNNATCLYYDVLQRITAKAIDSTPADTCPPSPPSTGANHLATYSYTNSGVGKIGLPSETRWSSVSANNRTNYSYDSLGRLTGQTTRIAGTAYTLNYGNFDALNRPTTAVYPNNETVTLTYDHEGANSLSSSVHGTIVSNLLTNQRGQTTQLALGSGLTTQYTYYSATDPAGTGNSNFRLKQIQTGSLLNFTYSYDRAGNVRQIADVNSTANDNQTFTYDHLGRLKTAVGNSLFCTIACYNHTYTYDILGNIATVNKSGLLETYNYSAGHPQALATVTRGSTNLTTLTYDTVGNLETRTQGTNTYNHLYDTENRLRTVTKSNQTTSFNYNDQGGRTRMIEPNGTVTLYPFPGYEVENPGLSNQVTRLTYSFAGQAVALSVKQGSGTAVLYYLHSDHLGSASVMSESGGTAVSGSLTRYLPFGGYRLPPGVNLTDQGFTGHLHNNDLGLIYMNARYYLPGVGRFASADTIVPDPKNPQQFNRYSYVTNNPLRFNDPTGHCGADQTGSANTDTVLYHDCVAIRDALTDLYGISIVGTWTFADMQTLQDSISLFLEGSSRSFGDTFQGMIKGFMRVKPDDQFPDGCYDPCEGLIAESSGKYLYITLIGGRPNMQHTLLHEMTHAFLKAPSRHGLLREWEMFSGWERDIEQGLLFSRLAPTWKSTSPVATEYGLSVAAGNTSFLPYMDLRPKASEEDLAEFTALMLDGSLQVSPPYNFKYVDWVGNMLKEK